MGANDTNGKLETIKQDFGVLGMIGLGVRVIFSSVLPVRGKDGRMKRWIFQVNYCLCCWVVVNRVLVSITMEPCLKIKN